MNSYIKLYDYGKNLDLSKDDIILITSDAKIMLWDMLSNKETTDLNNLIDGIIAEIGENGTIIIPTYNWGFCLGERFSYNQTRCQTGALGTLALGRNDFKRTKHPIYSFAVWGKYQEVLCKMDNKDSFGLDSPFAFMLKMNAKNIIIDVDLQHCFTFAHFAEQQSHKVDYRFIKTFSGNYIDENGKQEIREYSMFVRKLDKNVITTINPIEEVFLCEGAEEKYIINNSRIKKIDMQAAYHIMINDIVENKSRKLCIYDGQEEDK